MNTTEKTFTAETVKNLFCSIGAADLYVRENEDGADIAVSVENEEAGAFAAELAGDALHVKYEPPGKIIFHANANDAKITLLLPHGFSCDDFHVEAGAGDVTIEVPEFACKTAEFEVGAGKLKAEGLAVHETLGVEVGAGKAKLEQMEAANVRLEAGAGKCSYSGRACRNLSAECGVGHVKVALDGKETDYNYQISAALGKVSVNGKKTGGIVSEKNVANAGATGNVRLECGVGNIDFCTEE